MCLDGLVPELGHVRYYTLRHYSRHRTLTVDTMYR
jgi:hypothetical protein